jgi:hypothetical protein
MSRLINRESNMKARENLLLVSEKEELAAPVPASPPLNTIQIHPSHLKA